MRILIVDDDEILVELVRHMLEREGHRVASAGDGNGGLRLVRRAASRGEPFDVIITDWEMPGLKGPELCRAARIASSNRPPYVIMLTCRKSPYDQADGFEAGTDDYLVKPVEPEELLASIRTAQRARLAGK
jgi:DNA-binding response OmpR family regulator